MALTTIAPTVTKNGASAATYDEILEWLKTKYRAIYGDDVYLEADSLDGPFLVCSSCANGGQVDGMEVGPTIRNTGGYTDE